MASSSASSAHQENHFQKKCPKRFVLFVAILSLVRGFPTIDQPRPRSGRAYSWSWYSNANTFSDFDLHPVCFIRNAVYKDDFG